MKTYGEKLSDIPKGFAHRVHFPELMRLDAWTSDNRRIEAAGFEGSNRLPIPIMFLNKTTAGGHDQAEVAGRLDFITVHDDGLVSGDGFLLDEPSGHAAAHGIATQTLNRNSVDLRNVRLRVKFPDFEDMFKEDEDGFTLMPEVFVSFTRAGLGATTLVPIPAFEHARAELVASGSTVPTDLFVDPKGDFAITVEGAEVGGDQLTAAGGFVAPWEDFHIAEASKPTKIVVDADGRVYGHLGTWDSCHTGFLTRCVRIPRSSSNYASFCKPGVLTDRGMVNTGPIFLFGGHPENASPSEIERAYGGIENAWADVRVVDGRFGPWLSGRVRPGVTDEQIYAARASRISGHWFSGELYAIASVSAEGFDVRGGNDYQVELADDGEVLSLVASFGMGDCGCDEADEGKTADEEVAIALALLLAED